MKTDATSFLDKAGHEYARGDVKGALSRLAEGVQQCPAEIALYKKVIEIALEAGESRQSAHFFKKAWKRFPSERKDLWALTLDQVTAYNDAFLGLSLLDAAIKDRNFDAAEDAAAALKDHTAQELLDRTRTKQKTLSTAMNEDMNFGPELVDNLLCQIVLGVRAGAHADAIETTLKLMRDNPSESEGLLPYLLHLEKGDRSNAAFTFAAGCALINAQHWQRGIERLVSTASNDSGYAAKAAERVKGLRGVEDIDAATIDLALARIELANGDRAAAARHIDAANTGNSDKAAEIIAMLEPVTDEIGDDTVLDYLLIKVALESDRSERALSHMKKLYGARRHRAELLSWLQERHEAGALSRDALSYYAELAIAEGLFERAVSALRAVLSQSPQEADRIHSLLERHRHHATVETFWSSISARGTSGSETAQDDSGVSHIDPSVSDDAPTAPEVPETDDTGIFEPVEFSMGVPDSPPARAPENSQVPGAASDAPSDGFERDFVNDGASFSLEGNGDPGGDKLGGGFSVKDTDSPFTHEEDELPRGDDAWIDRGTAGPKNPQASDAEETWDTEGIVKMTSPRISLGGSTKNDTAPGIVFEDEEAAHLGIYDETTEPESLQRDESGDDLSSFADPVEDDDSAYNPVSYDASAETSEQNTENTDDAPTDMNMEDANVKAYPREDSTPPRDEYAILSERFLLGTLPAPDALKLATMAMTRGDLESARRYLDFEPENIAQDTVRKQALAEYYICIDRPLAALIILKTIRSNSLDRKQRHATLLLIAYCYRMLNRFDAAQSVYLHLLSEGHDSEAYEQMAQANYRSYMNEIAGGSPVLEKVTTLK